MEAVITNPGGGAQPSICDPDSAGVPIWLVIKRGVGPGCVPRRVIVERLPPGHGDDRLGGGFDVCGLAACDSGDRRGAGRISRHYRSQSDEIEQPPGEALGRHHRSESEVAVMGGLM